MSLKKTLLALIFPAALWAQSITTGAVTGIVTDPIGGGIADANVTLTGLARISHECALIWWPTKRAGFRMGWRLRSMREATEIPGL